MRVFYEYEDGDVYKRRFYVKLDNISEEPYKVFEASSTEDLITQIKSFYIKNIYPANIEIELWSAQNRMGKRLDILKNIPEDNEFMWARMVIKK